MLPKLEKKTLFQRNFKYFYTIYTCTNYIHVAAKKKNKNKTLQGFKMATKKQTFTS